SHPWRSSAACMATAVSTRSTTGSKPARVSSRTSSRASFSESSTNSRRKGTPMSDPRKCGGESSTVARATTTNSVAAVLTRATATASRSLGSRAAPWIAHTTTTPYATLSTKCRTVKRGMPPSTRKVRNGWPATASTTASHTQIVAATITPRRAPSRSESCVRAMTSSSARSRLVGSARDERVPEFQRAQVDRPTGAQLGPHLLRHHLLQDVVAVLGHAFGELGALLAAAPAPRLEEVGEEQHPPHVVPPRIAYAMIAHRIKHAGV